MRKLTLLPRFDIQLFAEGGDGGTGAGNGAEAAAPAQPQQGVNGNPLANVQYGKQEEAPAAAEQQEQVPDRNAQFEALIKGEYKDLYDQRVQDTIRRRLKGSEEQARRLESLTPLLGMLADKYGVDARDIPGITKALEDDDAFYEAEAAERGLSVQQVKELRKIRRENDALRAQMQEQQTKAQSDAIYAAWLQEAEQLKTVYPGFDFQAELQNEQFRNLLRSHVPMQTAFEVIHKDQILPAAMQYAASQVEQKVANAVRAGAKRPAEGAMGTQSAVVTKSDVSQLTKADRDEIDRRVARGERIFF